jgi:UPF0755 protein
VNDGLDLFGSASDEGHHRGYRRDSQEDEYATDVLHMDQYEQYEDDHYDDGDAEYDQEYDADYESEYDPEYDGDEYIDDEVDEIPSAKSGRRRHKRTITWAIVAAAVVFIGAGAYFGVRQVIGLGFYPDYAGAGDSDIVFEVSSGDLVRDIAANLQQADIVKSADAFVKAAKADSTINNVQPGFYVVRKHMSGAAAVAALLDPSHRAGKLEVRSGWQLDDTKSVDGKVTRGILSRISSASCATLNGQSTCISVATLQSTIASTTGPALGLPDWVASSFASVDPKHRLEGLIAPGLYNIKPGETAAQTLKRVLAQSSAQLQVAGLPGTGQQSTGFSPYQILIMASIVEREAGTATDMPKVARVLYNRLALPMNLQLDSTVDYALDRPMVATAKADEPLAGAYNTYGNPGLPPTPISSPSTAAIQAAEQPAAGPWLFFVVCQKDGTSCFAVTGAEHDKNVQIAHANGVF